KSACPAWSTDGREGPATVAGGPETSARCSSPSKGSGRPDGGRGRRARRRCATRLGAHGPPSRRRGPRPERTYLSRASGTSRRRGCGVAWSILRALGPSLRGQKSLRRQFKSAQPHSPTARRSRSNDLAIREAMAPEDGGRVVQLHVASHREEAPNEGRRRPHDPHGARLAVPLERGRRIEGGGDWRVADLPRLRIAPSTGARAVPCPAFPRGLRRRRDRRLSARLRVRGPRPGLRDRRKDPAPECMSETREGSRIEDCGQGGTVPVHPGPSDRAPGAATVGIPSFGTRRASRTRQTPAVPFHSDSARRTSSRGGTTARRGRRASSSPASPALAASVRRGRRIACARSAVMERFGTWNSIESRSSGITERRCVSSQPRWAATYAAYVESFPPEKRAAIRTDRRKASRTK